MEIVIPKIITKITKEDLEWSLKSKKTLTAKGFNKGKMPLSITFVVTAIEDLEDRIDFKGESRASRETFDCSGSISKRTKIGSIAGVKKCL